MIEMDGETVSIPRDKGTNGLPREGGSRRGGKPPGRPVLWDVRESVNFEPSPVWGCYPIGFVDWALGAIECRASDVLHVCSGALGHDVGGVRLDLRATAAPDVRADGRNLPFRGGAFTGVLIDPPYSLEYARDLYGGTYPRPSHLLREAARVLRPGGRVGFLHFLVPMPGSPLLSIRRTWGVTTGCGYRIRAFTVLQRRSADLFDE